MKRVVLLILLIAAFLTPFAQVHVRGYTRKDGTYVAPYVRSSPDHNPYNNYSYPGNTNPYTGKVATGNPDTYLQNYYNRNGGFTGNNTRYVINEPSVVKTGLYLKLLSKGNSYISFDIYNNLDNYVGYLTLNSDRTLYIYDTNRSLIKSYTNFSSEIIAIEPPSEYESQKANASIVERRIQYKDALSVFHVLAYQSQMNYPDSVKFTWYNDDSGIQSTTGGNGGTLLHGMYQVFNLKGQLIVSKYYAFGLEDGTSKYWNDKGELTSTSVFTRGELVSTKFKNDQGYYVEFRDARKMFTKGGERYLYDPLGYTVEKDVNIGNTKKLVTLYYPGPKQVTEAQFTSHVLMGELRYGEYQEFFEDGKFKIIGQYYDGTSLLNGKWTHYNEDGTVQYEVEYQVWEEKYPNGQLSVQGNLISDQAGWLRYGAWKWFDDKGKIIKTISYDPFALPKPPKKSGNKKYRSKANG